MLLNVVPMSLTMLRLRKTVSAAMKPPGVILTLSNIDGAFIMTGDFGSVGCVGVCAAYTA